MQFVSFFGMPLPAIPKGLSNVWLALVALLFSSMLCAQRVNVIDQKGTKASTGVEYTESATVPSSNLEGDLWLDISSSQGVLKVYSISAAGTASWIPLSSDPALDDLSDVTITNAANNEVLSYDASSSTWVNKSLAELKTIEIVNENSAYNDQNPLIIGLTNSNPLQSGSTSSSRFKSPDDADIYIIDKSNEQVYVVLGPLDANYDGKVITLVEDDNENPKITVYDSSVSGSYKSFYDDSSGTNDLFDLTIRYLKADPSTAIDSSIGTYVNAVPLVGEDADDNILYESVNFIWVNSENRWIPMR